MDLPLRVSSSERALYNPIALKVVRLGSGMKKSFLYLHRLVLVTHEFLVGKKDKRILVSVEQNAENSIKVKFIEIAKHDGKKM